MQGGNDIKEVPLHESLVSMCGLYCGACRSFLKGKCKGCADNAKASWCKVRSCCLENSYASCAECTEHADPAACGKYNSIISKAFGLVFNSDRRAGIMMIQQQGIRKFTEEMVYMKRPALKRWG